MSALQEGAASFFLWNTQVSIEAAILALLVLLVQRVFRKHLSASWKFGLWILVACRLVAPAIPQSTTSIFNWVTVELPQTSKTILISPKVVPMEATLPNVTGEPVPQSKQVSLAQNALLLAWLTGVVLLLLNLLLQHFKFRKMVAHQRQLTAPDILNLLEDCKVEMKITIPVVVVAAENISSPALFGCVRPRIVMPAGILKSLSLEDLRFVFLHELAHIKRCDIPINWIMTILQILHWYNPILWWGFARMRADREIACDAAVLRNTGEECSRPYGNAILKLIESSSRPIYIPGTTGIMEEKMEMQNRIRMIADFRERKAVPLIAVALFATFAFLGLTAKSSSSTVPFREKYKVVRDVSGSSLDEEAAELFFGGSGDVFALGNELGNFGTNDFTIEFRVKSFPGRDRYIMGKRFVCDNGSYWNLGFKSNGTLCFEMNHDKSGVHFQRVDGSTKVDDFEYHHVAVSRAGSQISIYVDGVLDGTLETSFIVDASNPAHFTLGKTVCTLVNGSPFFAGQLKDISIYNYPLSADTIQILARSK